MVAKSSGGNEAVGRSSCGTPSSGAVSTITRRTGPTLMDGRALSFLWKRVEKNAKAHGRAEDRTPVAVARVAGVGKKVVAHHRDQQVPFELGCERSEANCGR